MVVQKQVVDMRFELQEEFVPLPQKRMIDLEHQELHYPGWEKDYTIACEFFHKGIEHKFNKALRKLKDKQRVYDDYKAFTRLNALASLELAYPGSEQDKQTVETWHLKHPSDDETDAIFQDKLEGLQNKDKLFFGDRSHPNIKDLDELELTYPGWEADYQKAVSTHCDTPGKSFPDILHCLRQKQKLHEGDRSHWRLIELESLQLTYPGWENDVSEVKNWHLHNADTAKNDGLYAEVVEGMRDQQQIYLGWDHEDIEISASSKESNESLEAQGDFYKVELKDATEMKKCYDSIAEALVEHKVKVKKLIESHSDSSNLSGSRASTPISRRSPSPTPRDSSNATTRDSFNATSTSRRLLPQSLSTFTDSSRVSRTQNSIDSGPPPKQIKLGKCNVCFSRDKTHVFVPCGHICACAACSTKAMETSSCCPICRRQADTSHRVFLT